MKEADLGDIKESIAVWNALRNKKIGLSLLTSGLGIQITRDDYLKEWGRLPDQNGIYINMYMGIDESLQMWFHFVDSISDGAKEYHNQDDDRANILSKPFRRNEVAAKTNDVKKVKYKIEDHELMERGYQWLFGANGWFENTKLRKDENCQDLSVVRVFRIPISDFHSIFNSNNSESCSIAIVFLGLNDPEDIICQNSKYDNLGINEIEAILCGIKEGNDEIHMIKTENVSTPHPPFSINNFNLLEENESDS